MSVNDLASVNALLNGCATILLVVGWVQIKRRRDQQAHKRAMVSAVIVSALFLISYLIYHYNVGSVPYPYHDWTRPVYFAILIPHVILATVMVPFILLALWWAFTAQYERHVRVVRWVWPVWMFVSVTGVVIYLMLYVR
jgi:putative membrane protein